MNLSKKQKEVIQYMRNGYKMETIPFEPPFLFKNGYTINVRSSVVAALLEKEIIYFAFDSATHPKLTELGKTIQI